MTQSVAGERLKSFIERIERLEEERAALGADIREVYSEAKSSGFDVKTMRQVVRLRKLEPAERAEMDELLDLYKQALGMAGGSGIYAAGVEEAADLYNEGKTVDEVADELGVHKSEAGRLRQRAEKAGLLTVDRGRGRPRKTTPEKVSEKFENETNPKTTEKVSEISARETIPAPTLEPAPTSTGDGGGDPHQDAIPLRAGGPVDQGHEGQSHQPPELPANDDARGPVPVTSGLVLTSTDRLGRGLASLAGDDPGPIPDFLIRGAAQESGAR